LKVHQRVMAMAVAIGGRSTSAVAAKAAAIATAVAAVAVALAAVAAVAAALAVVATETGTEVRGASLRVPPRRRAHGRPSGSVSERHAASRRAIVPAAAPPVGGLRYAAKMAPLTRPPKAKKDDPRRRRGCDGARRTGHDGRVGGPARHRGRRWLRQRQRA